MVTEFPHIGLCFLAGLIGMVWGFSELVGAFKNETGRALGTAGAWLLILLNLVAAGAVFFVVAALAPNANNWLTAILVGLAWPTVLRNTSFKLAQPLQSDPANEAAAVRLEQAYATVQDLAQQMINNTLTRQRMKLVTVAVQHDLAALERYARLALIASPIQGENGAPADHFIDRIIEREAHEETKKALLAAFVLNSFGRDTLDDFLKDQRRNKAA